MTHPADTAGAVERLTALAGLSPGAFSRDVERKSTDPLRKDLQALLSLNATLQGKVDLAVGALEKLVEHFEDDDQHDEGAFDPECSDCRQLASARDTLSKIKEGAE